MHNPCCAFCDRRRWFYLSRLRTNSEAGLRGCYKYVQSHLGRFGVQRVYHASIMFYEALGGAFDMLVLSHTIGCSWLSGHQCLVNSFRAIGKSGSYCSFRIQCCYYTKSPLDSSYSCLVSKMVFQCEKHARRHLSFPQKLQTDRSMKSNMAPRNHNQSRPRISI